MLMQSLSTTKKVLANGYFDKRKLMGLILVKEALQVFLHIIDSQERINLIMAHHSFSTVSRLLNQVIYCDTLTIHYKWNILLNLIIDCDSFFHRQS